MEAGGRRMEEGGSRGEWGCPGSLDRVGAVLMTCISRPAVESTCKNPMQPSRKAEEMMKQDLRVDTAQGLLANM